ncbi:MAG: hypothetical protein HKN47_10060 [Pirellulaceae bacterium]|nr:hypothetical protein [Pirellulaceae bacterium]
MPTPEPSQSPPRDIAYRVLISLIVVVVIWELLTPLVPSVAMTTMKRFHLRTESFWLWAIQQPVPSMYNFGNTVEIHSIPPGMIDPILPGERPRYLNHFPLRRLTFADGRYDHLRKGDHKWFEAKSTYRGQELTTMVHAKPIGDGVYEIIRMDDPIPDAAEPASP